MLKNLFNKPVLRPPYDALVKICVLIGVLTVAMEPDSHHSTQYPLIVRKSPLYFHQNFVLSQILGWPKLQYRKEGGKKKFSKTVSREDLETVGAGKTIQRASPPPVSLSLIQDCPNYRLDLSQGKKEGWDEGEGGEGNRTLWISISHKSQGRSFDGWRHTVGHDSLAAEKASYSWQNWVHIEPQRGAQFLQMGNNCNNYLQQKRLPIKFAFHNGQHTVRSRKKYRSQTLMATCYFEEGKSFAVQR